MSVYRWKDPTKHYATRTYTWERHPDGRVTVDAPIRSKSKYPDLHMEWPWEDWCEIVVSVSNEFVEGRSFRWRSQASHISFGWERRARREFPEIVFIRGVWDRREIPSIEMPGQHWLDVVGCMTIEPPIEAELDRLALLLDLDVVPPEPEPPHMSRSSTPEQAKKAREANRVAVNSLARLWEAAPDIATQSSEEP